MHATHTACMFLGQPGTHRQPAVQHLGQCALEPHHLQEANIAVEELSVGVGCVALEDGVSLHQQYLFRIEQKGTSGVPGAAQQQHCRHQRKDYRENPTSVCRSFTSGPTCTPSGNSVRTGASSFCECEDMPDCQRGSVYVCTALNVSP